MKTLIVDASTSLKWILDDEENTSQARQLLKDYLTKKVVLIAPDLWAYEIANGLKAATERRIKQRTVNSLLRLLLKVQPSLIPMDSVIIDCFKNALKFNISVYDSLYVTLARLQKVQLITADSKLAGKLRSVKHITFLSEYS